MIPEGYLTVRMDGSRRRRGRAGDPLPANAGQRLPPDEDARPAPASRSTTRTTASGSPTCTRASSGARRPSETRLDERLINRFDYDGDYGTVLNRFLMQAAIGYPLTVHGTGGQTRAFIHIRDTVRCIQLAVEHPPERGERVRIFNQMTEVHRVIDLAEPGRPPHRRGGRPRRQPAQGGGGERPRRREPRAARPRARPDHARGRPAAGGRRRSPCATATAATRRRSPAARAGSSANGRPPRWRPPPGDHVAVVIAALDEAGGIGGVLEAIAAGGVRARVERSSSTTAARTARARSPARRGAQVARLEDNLGHGVALRVGYALAREHGARYIVTLDADGQWDPAELPGVLAAGRRRRGRLRHRLARARARRRPTTASATPACTSSPRSCACSPASRVTDTSSGCRAMRAEVTATVRQEQVQYQTLRAADRRDRAGLPRRRAADRDAQAHGRPEQEGPQRPLRRPLRARRPAHVVARAPRRALAGRASAAVAVQRADG